MPTIIDVSDDGAGTLETPSSFSNVFIASGVSLVADSTAIASGSQVSIVQAGGSSVVSFDSNAYQFDVSGSLTVAEGAFVQGGATGGGLILLSVDVEPRGLDLGPVPLSPAIYVDDVFELRNSGEIQGGSAGLDALGMAYVANDGVIAGRDAALAFFDEGAQVFNSGLLRGNEAVLMVQGRDGPGLPIDIRGLDDAEYIVEMPPADPHRIVNTGEIQGGFAAIRTFGDSADIVNEGLIVISGSDANRMLVDDFDFNFGDLRSSVLDDESPFPATPSAILHDTAAMATQSLINSGRIVAPELAYMGGADVDTIVNAGVIVGDVVLNGGADVYRGRAGSIEGKVSGGAGADMLVGGVEDNDFDGGSEADVLRGRGGDDALTGDAGGDLMFGGAGDDDMRGGADADFLFGQSGDDFLYGDEAPDSLFGGKGDDLLDGGIFSDALRGGAGDDQLFGGGGFDRLDGGRGDDELTGGAASDTFVMRRRGDDDVITDFQNGMDKIDLTAFGLRPAQYAALVAPALNDAGGGATFLDLTQLGGNGSVLIQGLAFAQAGASDFVL